MNIKQTAGARPLWQWSANDIVAAARTGEISCAEVVSAAVARMRALNPALNAVTLDLGEEALRAAEALDARRAAGDAPGPLFGVPITIKDNVDVRGQRTPNGVRAFAQVIAPEHSPVVKNLLDAGAVIIGRTNTPEFSMRATTNNALYGLTRNPWNADISCGGSSGGAGAAVAAGIGAIGHGNDIGGSIRFPALHCGVAGLKPSLGRVPAYLPSATGERPMVSSLMSVQGPLARNVADLRLALACMSAPDARDPWWVPAPLEGPPVARKVGLIEQIEGLPAAPAVMRAMQAAAQALRDAGYQVEPLPAHDVVQAGELGLRLLSTDMGRQIVPAARQFGSEPMRWYLDAWLRAAPPYADLEDYLSALAGRATLARRWQLRLEEYPVILIPQRMEPLLEVDEDLRGEAQVQRLLRQLTPSIAFNFLGLPSVLVPTGVEEGLPQGVQVVAGRFREDVCLAAAGAIEDRLGTLADQLWARMSADANTRE